MGVPPRWQRRGHHFGACRDGRKKKPKSDGLARAFDSGNEALAEPLVGAGLGACLVFVEELSRQVRQWGTGRIDLEVLLP